MTTHFRWYGDSADMTVSFNRTYEYPAEANHAQKSIVKIAPKNTSTVGPSKDFRIELPADGFMNPATTMLEFDVTLSYTPGVNDYSIIRFQNGIQSLFQRFRIQYGSTTFEDIDYCNLLGRILQTHTGTGQTGGVDQMSISEGVGGAALGVTGKYGDAAGDRFTTKQAFVNARQAYIQGISLQKADAVAPVDLTTPVQNWILHNAGGGFGIVPAADTDGSTITVTRRYQIPILAGLFMQPKLLFNQYMAQITLIWTTASNESAIFWQKGETQSTDVFTETTASGPTYTLSNVSLVTETLHFDAMYNKSFVEGIQKGGVPINFGTFHHYQYNASDSATQTLSISEDSRSVKSVFICKTRDPPSYTKDSGAMFAATATASTNCLVNYQFRLGSRVYPALPIECGDASTGKTNGGAEAYVNLQKALNTVGDQRLSTTADVINWCGPPGLLKGGAAGSYKYASDLVLLNEYDGKYSAIDYNATTKRVELFEAESSTKIDGNRAATNGGRCLAGNWSSQQFVMAMNFSTSNGVEISGINAQEQSDIHVTMKWSAAEASGFVFHAWTYVDSMIILMANSIVQIVV
jgi:hypothetical protein